MSSRWAGRKLRAALAVLVLAVGGTAMGIDTAELRRELKAAFSHPDFARTSWGCVVAGAVDGAVLFAMNPRKPLIPASNQKLYVSAAALARLGPQYRSRTEFVSSSMIRDGVLEGDLVVRGYGAFDLTARYPKREAVVNKAGRLNLALDNLVARLRRQGIRAIRGRVRADCSAWTDMRRNDYYPSAAPLLFNDNTLNVQVDKGRLSYCPFKPYMFKIVPVRSGDAQVRVHGAADTIRVNVRRNSTDYWRLKGGDPAAYYCGQLERALEARDILVENQYLRDASARRRTLVVTRGYALKDLLEGILAWSDNLRAEVLFLTLGYEVEGLANYTNGARACRSALARTGLRLTDFVAADGSGLSRNNRISAAETIDLLRWLRREHYGVVRDGLAVSGTKGTLEDHLERSDIKGRIFAKTGSLRGIRSLSGYARTRAGHPLCFSFVGNGVPSDARAWQAIEKACAAMCAYEGQ